MVTPTNAAGRHAALNPGGLVPVNHERQAASTTTNAVRANATSISRASHRGVIRNQSIDIGRAAQDAQRRPLAFGHRSTEVRGHR